MGAVAAAPLAIGAAGASVLSGMMQGSGTQAADNYQAEKAQVAAQYAKAAAAETDTQMRENLSIQLGNIDAVRAANHDDPTSPTGAAVRARTEMIGDRARSIQVGNIMAQASQDEADSQYLTQAGSFAYTSGIVSGIAGAAGKIAATKWG